MIQDTGESISFPRSSTFVLLIENVNDTLASTARHQTHLWPRGEYSRYAIRSVTAKRPALLRLSLCLCKALSLGRYGSLFLFRLVYLCGCVGDCVVAPVKHKTRPTEMCLRIF